MLADVDISANGNIVLAAGVVIHGGSISAGGNIFIGGSYHADAEAFEEEDNADDDDANDDPDSPVVMAEDSDFEDSDFVEALLASANGGNDDDDDVPRPSDIRRLGAFSHPPDTADTDDEYPMEAQGGYVQCPHCRSLQCQGMYLFLGGNLARNCFT